MFLAFTSLALQGFGGVLAVVQRELVEKKRWLTLDEFIEDWAVAQIMPGPNVVNLARKTPAVCTLVIRHLDRPGVLARILDAISEAGINVQEMANIVFDGAEAAVAQINLQTRPSDALLGAVRAIDAVLDAEIIDL